MAIDPRVEVVGEPDPPCNHRPGRGYRSLASSRSLGTQSADLAADLADGLVGTAPVAETIERFREKAGKDKPAYGQIHVCWAQSEEEAFARRWSGGRTVPSAAAISSSCQVGPDQDGFFDFYSREVLPQLNWG